MSDRPRARAPEVVAEEGWEPVEPPRLEGGRGSFVSGDPEGDRLRVRYFRRGGARPPVRRARVGPRGRGAPRPPPGRSTGAGAHRARGAPPRAAGRKGGARPPA